MTIFGCKFSFCICNELIVDVILYKVDGTASEATTHNTAACYTILFGYVIQEVKFLTTNLVFFAQTIVCLVHLLTNSFVVTFLKSIAYCQHAVFSPNTK